MDVIEAPMAWGLTRGMARALGVDLIEAVSEGWYSRTELARLVENCAGCTHADQCTAWLSVTPIASAMPTFCRNKHEIESLRF